MSSNKLNLILYSIFLLHFSEQILIRSRQSLYRYYKISNYDYVPLSDEQQSPISQRNNGKRNNGLITFRDNEKYLSEGSFCRRSADGRGGYCMLAYKCLHIVREFRKHGTKIDVCTYSQKIPVICCPLEEKDISLKPIVKKRISAIKCDEYNGLNSSRKDIYPRYKKLHNITKCESSLPLIVGGEITYPGEFPHMAAVGWRKTQTEINWACGGTLISTKFVLTAAHCTHLGGKKPEIVRLGEQNLRTTSKTPLQQIEISQIIVNPGYRVSAYYHDIALLKLSTKVILTKFIHPACLWQKSNFNFASGIAIGWGRKQFLGPKSNELLKVNLKIIDQNLCNKLYMNERRLPKGITDYQFCAGHLEGGKDTCQGDSGGPLLTNVIESKCIYYVVGITSFGKFCAAPNAPGVYTKVYAYIDWIESIVFNLK